MRAKTSKDYSATAALYLEECWIVQVAIVAWYTGAVRGQTDIGGDPHLRRCNDDEWVWYDTGAQSADWSQKQDLASVEPVASVSPVVKLFIRLQWRNEHNIVADGFIQALSCLIKRKKRPQQQQSGRACQTLNQRVEQESICTLVATSRDQAKHKLMILS